jgi:hypothetical protein
MGAGDSRVRDGLAAKKSQLLQTISSFRAGNKIGRELTTRRGDAAHHHARGPPSPHA